MEFISNHVRLSCVLLGQLDVDVICIFRTYVGSFIEVYTFPNFPEFSWFCRINLDMLRLRGRAVVL